MLLVIFTIFHSTWQYYNCMKYQCIIDILCFGTNYAI